MLRVAWFLMAALILAGSATASTRAFMQPAQMANLIEARGVSFSGFAHLNGFRVNVDVAKCLGLRRYGVQQGNGQTLFHGFKCSITTPIESRFTVWVLAGSSTSFSVDSALLVHTGNPQVQNCLDWGGTWPVCLGKYGRS